MNLPLNAAFGSQRLDLFNNYNNNYGYTFQRPRFDRLISLVPSFAPGLIAAPPQSQLRLAPLINHFIPRQNIIPSNRYFAAGGPKAPTKRITAPSRAKLEFLNKNKLPK